MQLTHSFKNSEQFFTLFTNFLMFFTYKISTHTSDDNLSIVMEQMTSKSLALQRKLCFRQWFSTFLLRRLPTTKLIGLPFTHLTSL